MVVAKQGRPCASSILRSAGVCIIAIIIISNSSGSSVVGSTVPLAPVGSLKPGESSKQWLV